MKEEGPFQTQQVGNYAFFVCLLHENKNAHNANDTFTFKLMNQPDNSILESL